MANDSITQWVENVLLYYLSGMLPPIEKILP